MNLKSSAFHWLLMHGKNVHQVCCLEFMPIDTFFLLGLLLVNC